MTKKRDNSSKAELRRQAEAKSNEHKKKTAASPTALSDPQRLVHELEVHQIELMMQNEELARARTESESPFHHYVDLYDFAPVGYFTLVRDGAIRQVNLTGADLLGVERGKLIKNRFGSFVAAESRPTFNAFLEKLFSTSVSNETCEILLQKNDGDPLWARIEATIKDVQS